MAYSESGPDTGTAGVETDQKLPKKKRVLVLGTGWAGTSFLKHVDATLYDVQVVSPRNYFAFTPLLPSVTCGTVEARSIVEPIRNIVKKVRDKTRASEIRLAFIFIYMVWLITLHLHISICVALCLITSV